MTAVLKHELRAYFHSLTAYVFGAFLLAFVGIGAMMYNLQAAVSNFEYVLSFGCLVFVVIVPILTMRVIAEERKQKTDQLLYSLPITTTQVVIGKYLALLTVYLIPLCIICIYPLIFSQFGDVYLLTSYGSVFAFFVLGAALIAVGVFISSLTENQGFAAGIGIAVILLNYYSVSLSEYVSSTATGSVIALGVIVLALGAVIRYLTKNDNLAYAFSFILLLAIAAVCFIDSSKFEGLLPRIMEKLSLFERFYTFVNGVFDMTAIYIQEADVYSYSYNTSFDGEGAITSAIDYVVSEELPQLYMLEGHGEAELPATFSEQIEKENIEVSSFSLLTVDSVPEEADCVLIYAPTSDISEEEQKMLANYVTDGGKLLVMAGPTEEGTLKNLYGLLEAYGVEASDGVVIEADREHYAFQAPYVLLPDMAGSDITDSLIEENYFPIMPISQGMKITGSSGNGTVTELLTTSDAAFSKIAGYSLSTYEKEEDDIDGPFSVALSVEANSGGKIVWFASSSFLEDMYNAYSSGANGDMAMNALSSLVGESEAMAIRSKSLNYNYLTISASTSSLLKVMMIGVFPLLYLGIGICVVLTRRKKQNETV